MVRALSEADEMEGAETQMTEQERIAQLQADYNSSQQTMRELRSQLAKRTFERDDASQSCDVMQAERDSALSELAELKKDKK